MSQVSVGIYEKALRNPDWDSFFQSVAESGFSFTDLSLDETAERSARLAWSAAERRAVRETAARHGVQIGGLCLSLHRRIGPGSADPAVRSRAAEVFREAVDLCVDLGIPVVQVAGYYAYYEAPDPDQKHRYTETLSQAADYAALNGVLLGIENVDGGDVTSISEAWTICEAIGSPWLQLYPDIGNLAEQELDTVTELAVGHGHMLALHAKDVLPGVPRRVPFGEGVAQFPAAFNELARQNWSGRMMIEMWNDDADDSAQKANHARTLLESWLTEAGLTVTPPHRSPADPKDPPCSTT